MHILSSETYDQLVRAVLDLDRRAEAFLGDRESAAKMALIEADILPGRLLGDEVIGDQAMTRVLEQ